jgi:hypothetical protein
MFAIAFGLAFGFWFASPTRTKTIATLIETKGCKWGAGTLPTELGAEFSPGRLRLVEGLARIVFSNGVEVRLESPADLELVSAMKCIMRSGKLVASVPPNARGFVIETPSSIVTDYGTEFGVSIGSDDSAVVQVFQGRVDTLHRRSGQIEVMHEGSVFYFGDLLYGPHHNAEQSMISDRSFALESRENWVHVTTAHGRGRDSYVQPVAIPDKHRSKGLLLLKRPFPTDRSFERNAYLGFDLAAIEPSQITKAELNLSFAPTGLGFASLVPDATFQVFGLIDGKHDDWSERDLTWENAPAHDAMHERMDNSQVVRLGTFVIPQGDQVSTASVSGAALSDFLSSDTNKLVTLIVVRETVGQGPSDLVHGFASRRHPTLPPPTLRLVLKDE